MKQADLNGLGVLLTRPEGQARRTAGVLRDAGAQVFLLPALEITPVAPNPQLDGVVSHARTANWVIFISANAVEFGLPHLLRLGGMGSATRIAAIGAATKTALAEHGYAKVVLPPAGNDSEALLAHPDLQRPDGEHIIIVRGQSEGGGRKLLGEVLLQRGAVVEFAECYLRNLPQPDPESLSRLLQNWERGKINAVHVMSVETLENLFTIVAQRGNNLLRQTWLLVPHERVMRAARELGCMKTVVCSLDDAQLVSCLTALKFEPA